MRTLKTAAGSRTWSRGRMVEGLLLLALSIPGQAQQPPAKASHLAGRILLVQNANSPVSRAVAADYANRRGVTHLLTVACPDAADATQAETIGFRRFQETIEAPLAVFLAAHPEIDFIVLTKGIPLRLADAPQGQNPGPLALDSHLASWGYDKQTNTIRVDVTDPSYGSGFHGMAWLNRFWDSRRRFSHLESGGYLVTRLDGYTEADAKSLTTRSLAAEKALRERNPSSAQTLLDACPGFGFEAEASVPHSLLPASSLSAVKIVQESKFGEFNTDMKLAAKTLSDRHIPVTLDVTERFVGNASALAGYASWGSNDQKFDPATYRSLRFAPGALCETAVSTSARTFLPTSGGQSLIVDLIAQGATGAKGYTDEPLLQAVASPSILFDRYTRGWTMAESYYAASRLLGWQDIVIGDPICQSYPEIAE